MVTLQDRINSIPSFSTTNPKSPYSNSKQHPNYNIQ
jgi:hypothetical protein